MLGQLVRVWTLAQSKQKAGQTNKPDPETELSIKQLLVVRGHRL